MRTSFFPLKKLRRNAKYLLLFAVVMTGVFAAYLEFAATTTSTSSWNDYVQPSRWNDLNPALRREVDREFHSDNEQVEEGRPWESSFRPQLWRPEYKGQANLHIFEDWCGGSTAQLRKNLHYPLYPHSRTTVKKLAVSPRWTNYGLRIFGYLHPHTDGEYRFAVASDDDSEFWLSTDDSPLNVRLLALVGKTGTEWTAPGEFGKYSSQTSHPVKLTTSQRYYFEVIHKQNDKGTDHVEVAWQLRPGGMRFTVIASEHISLYTNESALMMTEVSHIPQTAASHVRTASERRGSPAQNVDILREDRRDTFHQLPLIDEAHLRNVLPECSYSPTYIIKDFPLVRYQGLQFVRMSYIYPNDYTRLTHMETDNKCFYHANAQDLDSVGFSRYMRMDFPERLEDGRIAWDTQGAGFGLEDEDIQYEEDQGGDDNEEDQTEDVAQERSNNLPDYGDDYDDYAFNRKRKLFSMTAIERPAPAKRRKRQAKANIQEPPAQVPDTNQKEDQEVKVQRKKKSRRKSRIDSNGGSDVLPPNPLPAGKNASGFEMANKGSHAIPVQELGLNTSQIEHHLVAGGPKANIVPLEKVNSVKNRTLNREVEQPAPPPITNLQAPPAGHLVLPVNRSREIVPVNQIDVQENFVKRGRISKDRGRFHRRNEVLEREESELDNTIDQILQKPPAKQANREANEGRGERGRPLVRKANRERNDIELEQDRPLARKSNRSVNDVKIEQDQPLARKANREGNDIALERDRPLARQANREGNVIVLERDRPLAREAKRGFNDVELDRDRPLPRKYNISVNDVKIEQGQPLARKANGEGNDIALERDRPLARQANREGNDIALERAQPLARQANREGNVITLERDRPLALEAERGFNDVELEWDRPIARKSNISVNDVEIEQGQPLARKANREVNDEESEERRPDQALEPTEDLRRLWAYEDDTDEDTALGNELMEEAPWDPEVNWRQTFDVDPLDFHTLRSDWIDLNCNVSGNLLLKQSDALAVVAIFMDKLNKKHPGRFALLQVVNVEKRLDGSQGSRYLLELELLEQGRSRVRLSRYVYMAQRRSRPRILGRIKRPVEMVLCDPQGLAWNPSTTVHFIVPVKNQARWVKQFIVDMEDLYRKTKDKNFNIIITDYSSTDMDVEQELKNSAVPRYQYVKLSGNFERSAGLQAGIDLITDNHSIVFLCDLHIHFPPSIIDSIRKHCVEGKMAFAPIVMRLNCGATPQEPTGYWEVNGFGLLGIYKSDLDTAGGMNTKEFRDRWGGEDWELLDRILQAGLEVERIYLRNFMHHYHSKRGMWNRQTFKAT